MFSQSCNFLQYFFRRKKAVNLQKIEEMRAPAGTAFMPDALTAGG